MSNPVPQTDAVFLKHFAQLILALMLVAVVLIAIAAHVYGYLPEQGNDAKNSIVDTRIAPVGGVHAGETGRAAIAAAEAAAKAAAAAQVAYGGSTDGKVVYDNLCHACHTAGVAGAPVLGDKAQWAPRVSTGLATLVKHAIEGYTGAKGIMPARGGNPSLNDEQVKATVEWMVDQVK